MSENKLHEPYVKPRFVGIVRAADRLGMGLDTVTNGVAHNLLRLVVGEQAKGMATRSLFPLSYLDEFVGWRSGQKKFRNFSVVAAAVFAGTAEAERTINFAMQGLEQALASRLTAKPPDEQPAIDSFDLISLLGVGKGTVDNLVEQDDITPLNPGAKGRREPYLFGVEAVRTLYAWHPPDDPMILATADPK